MVMHIRNMSEILLKRIRKLCTISTILIYKKSNGVKRNIKLIKMFGLIMKIWKLKEYVASCFGSHILLNQTLNFLSMTYNTVYRFIILLLLRLYENGDLYLKR